MYTEGTGSSFGGGGGASPLSIKVEKKNGEL